MHHGQGWGGGGEGAGILGPFHAPRPCFPLKSYPSCHLQLLSRGNSPKFLTCVIFLLLLFPSTSVIHGERQKKDNDVYHAFSVSVDDLFLFLSPMKRVWCEVRIGQPAVMCLQNSRGLARNHLQILCFFITLSS